MKTQTTKRESKKKAQARRPKEEYTTFVVEVVNACRRLEISTESIQHHY